MKLASRLSALYAVLLGVTVLIVILASSIALVVELSAFTGDVVIAKHEEARILADRFHREGMTLAQSAPEIVAALSGIGLRVTVFDNKGRYLAGDKTLRPRVLDRVLALGGMEHFIPRAPAHLREDRRRTRRASSRCRSLPSKAGMWPSSRLPRCC